VKKIIFSLLLLCLVSRLPSNLKAEDKQQTQNQPESIHHEVVVTATRLESPVKEIASAITLIKTKQLIPFSLVQPEKIFSLVPGAFFLQNGFAGGSGSLFLRGASSEHTLFMIDGLEINDPIAPSRSFNFNLFNLSLIDRIEILRGPQSTLYGSDALAGVVNLITTEPSEREVTLTGFFGSYQTWQGNFGLAQKLNSFSFALDFSSFNTQGLSSASSAFSGNSEADGFNQQSLALRLQFSPSRKLSIVFQTRALFSRSELDNFGGAYGDDPNSIQKASFFFNRIEFAGSFFHFRWQQKLILGFEANHRRNDNPADDLHPGESETALYQSRFFKLDWQNNLFLDQYQVLLFGLDYKIEEGSSDYSYFSPWGNYESNFPMKKAVGMGLYLQHQTRRWKQLSLTSGFRYDHYRDFGSALTFRVAASFNLPRIEARLKSTLGSGFKAPSLYQLYAPPDYLGPIGNQQLKPEKNLGWDVGLEKTIGKELVISLTYFESHYRNLIQFYFGSGYQNLGRVMTRGLESSLEAKLLEALDLNIIWTHLRAVDQDTKTQLVRRPRDTIHLSLNYSLHMIRTSLEFYYLSQRFDVDYSEVPARAVTLKPALISNFVLSYDLKNRCSLFLKIDNLFNTRYELVYGYGTPGTTISTGFRLKL